MPCSVDNLSEYNQKRVQLYTAIKEYNSAGYSKRQISKVLNCSRNTVTKYLNGEYEALCKKDFRSGMDQFYNYIIQALTSGISRKDVYRNVIEKGYKGGQSAAYDYMNKIIERFQIDVAIYKSSSPEATKCGIPVSEQWFPAAGLAVSVPPEQRYSRTRIFTCLL